MVAETLRILVIGKTGNGKSTVGNILLGTDAFLTGRSMASTTLKAKPASVEWKGIQITVVDTPDPVNWDGSSRPDLVKEIQSWKAMTSPGPSAILLAIRCDVRYTAEEYDVYKRIKVAWGDSSFTRRLVVTFTFGDRQDRPIEQELREVCPELKSVLRDAENRYIVFNGPTDKRDMQLDKLLGVVRQIIVDPKPHFTSVLTPLCRVVLFAFSVVCIYKLIRAFLAAADAATLPVLVSVAADVTATAASGLEAAPVPASAASPVAASASPATPAQPSPSSASAPPAEAPTTDVAVVAPFAGVFDRVFEALFPDRTGAPAAPPAASPAADSDKPPAPVPSDASSAPYLAPSGISIAVPVSLFALGLVAYRVFKGRL